jgi:hypothetical protein
MSDIFISHVEDDAEVALEIALGLEEAGYSTWCYELDGIPGPSYLLQTGQAVANCKAVVVVISPHSVGSRQVTKEVVRAHESDKDFIPVRRGISHIEFQNRQPEWREAIGAATSIGIPEQGAASILPRIIAGLKNLGFQPATEPDSARITQIREALGELPVTTKRPKVEHSPAALSALEGEDRDAAALMEKITEKVAYNTALRWIGAVFGVFFILIGIGGISYFAEHGLVSELIVGTITIISAIALLLTASVPQWVSTKLKIKLDKRSVFIIVLVVLVTVPFIAYMVLSPIGPELPMAW